MLPTTTMYYEELETLLTREVPTKTYYIDFEKKRIVGKVDGQEAMKQAILKILLTERYDFKKVYSDYYGVELKDMIGLLPFIVRVQLEPKITEALLCDDRIKSVVDFDITVKKKVVSVNFTVKTIFGDVQISDFEVTY